MAKALIDTSHRPWAPPERPWLIKQSWLDLLFAHWPVSADELRSVVPAALPLDTHSGSAWIGVVPFRIAGSRLRGLPAIPSLTAFPETNVRTYVTVDGKPGVYFFSLDATSRLAVAGGRRIYGLPYYRGRMTCARAGQWIHCDGQRVTRGGTPPRELRARYRPTDDPFHAVPGSLEHFLVERYCLYGVDKRGRVRRADIHHPRWQLQPAEAAFELNSLAAGVGAGLGDSSPLLHFCARQDALIWSREPV